jgi:Domain of unknown function (DUF6965)
MKKPPLKKRKRKPLDLDYIEKRLTEVDLPDEIILDAASTIKNVKKFFDSHLVVLRYEKTAPRIRKLHEDRLRIAMKAIKKHNTKNE